MDPSTRPLAQFISQLSGQRALVIGDIGLDEYVTGPVRRISPEAPVPVVEVSDVFTRLGLGANVALNINALGGTARLVGVVGQDSAGEQMARLLTEAGLSPSDLVVDSNRPTTRKMRIMSQQHHVVRVDFEKKSFLPPTVEQALMDKIKELLPQVDVVILQDYAKGVLREGLIQDLIAAAHGADRAVLIDPNAGTPLSAYRNADLIKPNRDEAFALVGARLDDLREKPESYREVGWAIQAQTGSPHVVMTRGKAGMSLFSASQVLDLPTYAREVFDVSGAGDTVIATLGLCWGAGVPLPEACALANAAASVVVGQVGTVPCRHQDLLAAVEAGR